jgi:UDP-N-acetylglucosamine diphosphorylase/glucosamine-1-phosphate N-acetyltransferase
VGAAIAEDVAEVVAPGATIRREPFGIVTEEKVERGAPPWHGTSRFKPASELGESSVAPGAVVNGAENLWLAQDVRVGPGAVLDAARGPLVIDRTVTVMPHAYLEGPLYIGPGSTVKAGAHIYGETSIGLMCKVAGEIAESTLLDFVNKQHDGFIGHAYLASWVNLGAGTVCSDLKNNYGTVRVDLGQGPVDTGLQFVGLFMGEHGKSAIGTRFNTGTCIGFASNVFGTGFPAKYLPNFTWGDNAEAAVYDAVRAARTAAVVMSRRGVRFTDAHSRLFRALARQE